MPQTKKTNFKNDVPGRHQFNIAKRTLQMSDLGASIMGGMTKDEARTFLKKHGYDPAKYE